MVLRRCTSRLFSTLICNRLFPTASSRFRKDYTAIFAAPWSERPRLLRKESPSPSNRRIWTPDWTTGQPPAGAPPEPRTFCTPRKRRWNGFASRLRKFPRACRIISHCRTSTPPVFQTPGWQTESVEIRLNHVLASFCASICGRRGLSISQSVAPGRGSPPAARFDLKSELTVGFPYTIAHAHALAAAHARLMSPPAPRKGIITDLDDTLWNGLAGEVGPDGISWDLSAKHHLHALYQNLLSSSPNREF